MKFKELLNHLFEIADKKFADFSKSLSNSDYISIGVKNPILKQLVKDHIKDEELKTEEFESVRVKPNIELVATHPAHASYDKVSPFVDDYKHIYAQEYNKNSQSDRSNISPDGRAFRDA